MRSPRNSAKLLGALVALSWFTACSDNPGDPSSFIASMPDGGVMVSNPVPAAALGGEARTALALASGAATDLVYVSLAPGTVPAGSQAIVRRVGDATSLTTTVAAGGFDPVPIVALAGDSIDVVVTDAGGAVVYQVRAAVVAARPPVIVRTEPPPRKRDVPLNASIVIVFSEPIEGSALNTSSVLLFEGESSVAGTVGLLQGTATSAVFVPAALLDPNTDYRLIVTRAVHDLQGETLAAADTVDFTTGSTVAGPPARVNVIPHTATLVPQGQLQLSLDTLMDAQGTLLSGVPISWASADPGVASVDASGLVTAIVEGQARVSATVEGVSDTAILTIGIPAPVEIAFQRGYNLYATNAAGSFQFRLTNTNSDDRPHWSPDGSKIAFMSQRDGNEEIYVMSADGSGQVNLTNNPATDVGWAWSHDGRKIAFSSDRDRPFQARVGPFQIYVMNADGSGLTRLTHDSASDVEARWSPDGSKIAFVSGTALGTDIYVMNADGSGVIALTSGMEPDWSPDGSKIAFSNGAVHVMNADGTGVTTLASGWQPRWSPDGSKIAFYRVTNTRGPCSQSPCNQSFYVINADGSGLVQLSNQVSVGGITSDVGPSWSTDGSRLAFVSTPSGGSRELFVVDADGSGLVNVTKSTGAGFNPAWKPR